MAMLTAEEVCASVGVTLDISVCIYMCEIDDKIQKEGYV